MQVDLAQVSLDEHGRLDPLELSNWYPVSCLLSLQHRCLSQAQTVWFSPSTAGTQAAGDDGKEEPHVVTPWSLEKDSLVLPPTPALGSLHAHQPSSQSLAWGSRGLISTLCSDTTMELGPGEMAQTQTIPACLHLKPIIQRQVSQKEKNKSCINANIWNLERWYW